MKKRILTLIITLLATFSFYNLTIAQESTESADSVREKVREKIQKVLNRPKAYLGTITDKTGETLQIKNTNGEIQFISVIPEETSFVSVGKTSKDIEYDEVAIGDFVVAMGYILEENEPDTLNGNAVLAAKRVLITEEISAPERKISFGSVIDIENKILTLNTSEGEEEFEFPRRWKGPEIDEISENDQVGIVSYPDEGKSIIRTIEIISNQASDEE